MTRKYKLAHNFNTVEFELTPEIIEEYRLLYGDVFDEDELADNEVIELILQKEYNTLASIKPKETETKVVPRGDEPSEAQIAWARNLGLKNPENYTKKELQDYIRKNKDK